MISLESCKPKCSHCREEGHNIRTCDKKKEEKKEREAKEKEEEKEREARMKERRKKKKAVLASKNAEIASKKAEIAAKDTELAAKDTELAAMKAKIIELTAVGGGVGLEDVSAADEKCWICGKKVPLTRNNLTMECGCRFHAGCALNVLKNTQKYWSSCPVCNATELKSKYNACEVDLMRMVEEIKKVEKEMIQCVLAHPKGWSTNRGDIESQLSEVMRKIEDRDGLAIEDGLISLGMVLGLEFPPREEV